MNAVKRGALIVLEGCDRTGKSSQCKLLVDRLCKDGIPAQPMRFPDRTTTVGKMINSYLTSGIELDDRAIHLLFSANRWEAVAHMKQMIEQGKTLVIDRYAYSGVAFSASKGLDLEWCKQSDIGLPMPDLVVFLNLSIEEAEKRGDFGGERYEKRDMQIEVKRQFEALQDESWCVLDANTTIESLHQSITKVAKDAISTCHNAPLSDTLFK